MTLVWSEKSVSECPGCGATVAVGIMSLAATCACGMYYVDLDCYRGWYSSREAFERGDPPVKEVEMEQQQQNEQGAYQAHCIFCHKTVAEGSAASVILRVEAHERECPKRPGAIPVPVPERTPQ